MIRVALITSAVLLALYAWLRPHPDLALSDEEFDAKYLRALTFDTENYVSRSHQAARRAKDAAQVPGEEERVHHLNELAALWAKLAEDNQDTTIQVRERIRAGLAGK